MAETRFDDRFESRDFADARPSGLATLLPVPCGTAGALSTATGTPVPRRVPRLLLDADAPPADAEEPARDRRTRPPPVLLLLLLPAAADDLECPLLPASATSASTKAVDVPTMSKACSVFNCQPARIPSTTTSKMNTLPDGSTRNVAIFDQGYS